MYSWKFARQIDDAQGLCNRMSLSRYCIYPVTLQSHRTGTAPNNNRRALSYHLTDSELLSSFMLSLA